jgi:hypothetical protein
MARKIHGVMENAKDFEVIAAESKDQHMPWPSHPLVLWCARSRMSGVIKPNAVWHPVRPRHAWPARIIDQVGDGLLHQEPITPLGGLAELAAAGG